MTGSWMMEIFVLATGNCRGVEIRASTEKYRNLREWEKGQTPHKEACRLSQEAVGV